MRPLLNIPSLGTVGAEQSRFLVVVLLLFPVWVVLPLLMGISYAVNIVAIWHKQPSCRWRCFLSLSVILGLSLGIFVAYIHPSFHLDNFLITPLLVVTTSIGITLIPIVLLSHILTIIMKLRS